MPKEFRLGQQSLFRDLRWIRAAITQTALPSGATSDEWGKILLIPDGGSPITVYAMTQAGFTSAVAALTSGDVIRVSAGTIAGDHNIGSGESVIGLGKNTIFSGAISNSGTLINVKITGSLSGTGEAIDVSIGTDSIIAAGRSHDLADSEVSIIAGGTGSDMVGQYGSTLSGGANNFINISDSSAGAYNTLAGGFANLIRDGESCFVGGGFSNVIDGDVATADYNVIVGGISNEIITSNNSAILGGSTNVITSANYATITGGRLNDILSGADYAFAQGRRCQVSHQGAVLFADSTDANFASAANDEFAVRAVGGLRFITNAGSVTIDANAGTLITCGNAATVPLTVKAAASQSANLTEWQDSNGALMGGIDERGVPFCDLDTVNTNYFAGEDAGDVNASGAFSIGIGYRSLEFLTTGHSNCALGPDALRRTTEGNSNMAVGRSALGVNTTGGSNMAFGAFALNASITGSNNTAIGSSALESTTASGNVGIGQSAGRANITGGRNTFIGLRAGHVGTSDNLTESMAIGQEAQVTASNTMVLGGTGSDSVQVVINATSAVAQFDINVNDAARVGQIIKGAAAQSANLLELQESDGSIMLASGDGLGGSVFSGNQQLEDIDFVWAGDTEANLFRIDAGLNVVRLGDWDTNYAQFAVDGEMTLVGTARVLRSVDFEPDALKKGGVGPTDSTEDSFPIHDYQSTNDESVFVHWEIPHDYASAGEIHLHVEFFVDTAPVGAASVTWGVEYKKQSIGDNFDFGAGTTTAITNTAITTGTPANDKKITNSGLIQLITTGFEPMDIVLIRIFRDANASEDGATDSFGNDARVFNYHLMYLSDKLGEAT